MLSLTTTVSVYNKKGLTFNFPIFILCIRSMVPIPYSEKVEGGKGDCQIEDEGKKSPISNRSTEQEEYLTRRRRKSVENITKSNDPLSFSFRIILYPIFLLALILIHSIYYLLIKIRSSWRYQRSIVQFIQNEERSSKQHPSKQLKRRRPSIEQKYEQAAQIRLAKLGSNDQFISIPRHIALALGPKPRRTSLLLLRTLAKPFTKFFTIKDTGSDDTREQEQFAWDNLQAALRNCALSGIRELTIYDRDGHLAAQFSETYKESIEQEWRIPSDVETDKEGGNHSADNRTMQITATIYRPFRSPTLNEFRRQSVHSPKSTNPNNSIQSVQVRINILGPEDSFEALAKAATILCKRQRKDFEPCRIDEKMIRDVLSEHGYPSDPELLIIHGGPRQVSTLHGFPPWLVRLCEIYHDIDAIPYQTLTSRSFEKALEAFGKSEQRLGK